MNFKLILALFYFLLLFTTSCWKPSCSDCEILSDDTCINDSINHKCPSGANYGSYDYFACSYLCFPGWMGTTCDQRDSNYYISFRYGSDTSALSRLLSTNDYAQIDSPDLSYEGYLPIGSDIDTVRIKWLPFLMYGHITPFRFAIQFRAALIWKWFFLMEILLILFREV
jgi:hypothetical protein